MAIGKLAGGVGTLAVQNLRYRGPSRLRGFRTSALALLLPVALFPVAVIGGDDVDQPPPLTATRGEYMTPGPGVDTPTKNWGRSWNNIEPGSATAPDGGRLQVTDRGFTQRDKRYLPVRAAIIIENTSKTRMAYLPTVIAHFLDPAGRSVMEFDEQEAGKRLVGGPIYPGGRTAITTYFHNGDQPIVDLKIEVVGADWSVLPPSSRGSAPLAAHDVTTIRSGADGLVVLAFKVHSDYSYQVKGLANAVFRDATGRIIGGTKREYETQDYLPGVSPGSIVDSDWYPDNVDDSRTEVYLIRQG